MLLTKAYIDKNNKLDHIIMWTFSFELFFILFLFAGLYKGDPRLAWIPMDLTALFFGLSFLTGIIILWKNSFTFKRKAFVLVIFYMIFAGYVLLSFIWTPSIIYATQKTLYIWTLVLWALVAPALIISIDYIRLKRLGIIYILLSFIVVVEAAPKYLMSSQYGFISVFGSNYLGLGRVVGLAFIIVVAYYLFWAKNLYQKLFAIIIASLQLWILLISGGRGPFLSAIFSALIPLLFMVKINYKRLTIKVRKFTVPILIITMIAVLLFTFFAQSGQMSVTFNRLLVLTTEGMGDSAGARMQHYGNAFQYWQKAPVVGHGIGSWTIVNNGIDMRGYPHNIIMEILVELGFVGLLAFLALIIYTFSLLAPLKSIGENPVKILLLMLTVFMLLNSMVSGDIPDNRLLFTCIGLMPAALYGGNEKYG